jgi:hypothetical protein
MVALFGKAIGITDACGEEFLGLGVGATTVVQGSVQIHFLSHPGH